MTTKPNLRAVTATPRQGISKKRRFDLFKRDAFTCQYCGRNPPAVVLEIDHIVALSSGGSNLNDNLVTACYECNRGKAAGDLASIPQSLKEQAELVDERRRQVAAYERTLRLARKATQEGIELTVAVYERMRPGFTVSERGRSDIGRFLISLPPSQIADAMELAFVRIGADRPDDVWRYFCGICWRRVKEGWK